MAQLSSFKPSTEQRMHQEEPTFGYEGKAKALRRGKKEQERMAKVMRGFLGC